MDYMGAGRPTTRLDAWWGEKFSRCPVLGRGVENIRTRSIGLDPSLSSEREREREREKTEHGRDSDAPRWPNAHFHPSFRSQRFLSLLFSFSSSVPSSRFFFFFCLFSILHSSAPRSFR